MTFSGLSNLHHFPDNTWIFQPHQKERWFHTRQFSRLQLVSGSTMAFLLFSSLSIIILCFSLYALWSSLWKPVRCTFCAIAHLLYQWELAWAGFVSSYGAIEMHSTRATEDQELLFWHGPEESSWPLGVKFKMRMHIPALSSSLGFSANFLSWHELFPQRHPCSRGLMTQGLRKRSTHTRKMPGCRTDILNESFT